MKTIIRTLCVLIGVLVFNLNISAKTFWAETLPGNPVFGEHLLLLEVVEGNPGMVTVQANMGPGLTVEALLLDMPWYYSIGAVSGNFGDPIMGMGNFASPLNDVRFPTKVVFWGGDPFDQTDSISFGGGLVIPPIVPNLTGNFSSHFLVVPPAGPKPAPWVAMALINDATTGESGWVGVCPVPEPVTSFLCSILLIFLAFWRRKCRHQNIWRLRAIKAAEGGWFRGV